MLPSRYARHHIVNINFIGANTLPVTSAINWFHMPRSTSFENAAFTRPRVHAINTSLRLSP